MANETKVRDLIVPEVMEEMIREKLPNQLVFSPLLNINDKLEGIPGNTITVPKFRLIGMAEDVAELGAIPYEKLTTSKTTVTIKKVGKGVQFSDEAILSGFGDPLGEGTEQLGIAVARKIDADTLSEIKKAKLKYNRKSVSLSYDVLADGLTKFGERINVPRVMFITPDQYAELRKDKNFLALKDIAGKPLLMTGVIGELCGVQLVVTSNADLVSGAEIVNPIVEAGAVGLLLKRKPFVETDRDIDHKATKINVDQHYGIYIKDDSKILLLTTKKPEITASEE